MSEMSSILHLEELRREISAIDTEILLLAGKRSALAAKIGELKREIGLDVVDPKREGEVRVHYHDRALEAGVSEMCAERIAEVLMEEGRRVQKPSSR